MALSAARTILNTYPIFIWGTSATAKRFAGSGRTPNTANRRSFLPAHPELARHVGRTAGERAFLGYNLTRAAFLRIVPWPFSTKEGRHAILCQRGPVSALRARPGPVPQRRRLTLRGGPARHGGRSGVCGGGRRLRHGRARRVHPGPDAVGFPVPGGEQGQVLSGRRGPCA